MNKFSSFLFVLLLMLASFTASAQEYPRGDVDGDGRISVADVATLIDYLLNGDVSGLNLQAADVDVDGSVSIADVATLIDYLLTGTWEEPVTPPDGHEYVDLGLPSGTLWATCNVGADSPEGYGDYFAWGETEPKEYYDWSSYKWCNGSENALTKYCTDRLYGYNGFTDGKTELDPEDDAAYVNWGEDWRMPTYTQMDELKTECTWTWTMQNGVNGCLMTGPNGNSLFLPAAGNCRDGSLRNAGSGGYYWSCLLYSHYPMYAHYLYFYSGGVSWNNSRRWFGRTVRPVRVPQN